MSENRSATLVVADAEAGERLDRLLAARVGELSRSRHNALILAGHVAINGQTIRDPSQRVNAGEMITLELPPTVEPPVAAEPIPLTILYEDDDIIVIDKPARLVVHPAAGNWTGTLVNALIAHCGESLSGIGGTRRPGIVHRLDKDTGGVLVAAKNDRAHRALSRQFAHHGERGSLRRGYLAFVWGVPERPHGVIDKPIARHPLSREKMAVREGGRRAVTRWQVLERFVDAAGENVASLLECRLETGRTHQIRVHMASIGHPLMGDSVYGAGFFSKAARLTPEAQAALADLGRQALHAYVLAIEHPSRGENLEFRSELPEDLVRLSHSLGAQSRSAQSPTNIGQSAG